MDVIGIILAAGKGTRFKSETPKVIHKILGKPMAFFPYLALKEGLKPKKIAFIVGHKADLVRKTFENLPEAVFFYQENPKGGTGDAVSKALPLLEEHPEGYTVILNGDSPLITAETLEKGFEKVKDENLDGLIFTTELQNPKGYGRIVRNQRGEVVKIVEEKDASEEEKKIKEVNGGFYIFKTKPLIEALKELKPSPVTGEVYLTDVVEIFAKKGLKVDTYKAPAEELLGVNDRIQQAEAEKILLRRKIENLQSEGVTVRLPETVYIEWDASVGKDTEIEPHAVIKGNTTIGENCLIGTGAVLENAKISDGVQILPYSFVSDSEIKSGAVVGPFARIRNDSVIGEKAEIGNFVEVKKTAFGGGSKAKHLAYVGDATVGRGVNIGAGVVFANYDGINKHQTFVGDNTFIGSNSLLIAPIRLEDWSFVAGGSVVNKDVPKGALAIGRAKLKVLENKNPLLRKKTE